MRHSTLFAIGEPPSTKVEGFATIAEARRIRPVYSWPQSHQLVTQTLQIPTCVEVAVHTGARLYTPAGDWQGYLGAAFEYDFTGTLRNEANGVEIRGGESIRGATGIGEAGIRHAKAGSPWLFDVRLRGYCGKREGASLKLQAEYGF